MATTKNELELENKNLALKVKSLQKTIGNIRRDVARIEVPASHADTLRKVLKTVDKAIDRS